MRSIVLVGSVPSTRPGPLPASRTDGCHQGFKYIGGSGPYLEVAALTRYLAEKVAGWDAWWVVSWGGIGAPELFKNVERITGKPEQGGA